MNHYFDDIFHRYEKVGTPHSSSMPRIRRSSTARSLGARSDFFFGTDGESETNDGELGHDYNENGQNGQNGQNSQNGQNGDDAANGDDDPRMRMSRRASRSGSMFFHNPERVRERAEADQHLHKYIADQLQRYKSSQSLNNYEQGDEFEAQADKE